MRESILKLATLAGVYAVVVTELLSLLKALTPVPVAITWIAFALAWLIRFRPSIHLTRPATLEWLPVVVVGLVLATTLLLVCLAPPNNWDVILYHLPRQVQWMQQASVAHFPTQDYRLTVNPPFSEYLGLHLMLLTGSDRGNAAVSWCALVLTLVAISLVAKEAGGGPLAQWLAAAITATIPIAIHEATSGKNDGMVALWLAAAAFWLMKNLPLAFGAAIGLLMLTKGTGLIFALPLIAYAVLCLRPWRRLLLGGLAAVLLNTGQAVRNWQAYGSPAGQTFGLNNQRHDPPAIASNVLRNTAMHFATPYDGFNQRIVRFVSRQHRGLGLEANDPATTWGGGGFLLDYAPQAEHATAPGHLLLFALALLLRNGWPRALSLLVLAGFFLFCVAFKWQPWHPRLHLPLLTLASVPVAMVLSKPYLRVLSPLVVAALTGLALPAMLCSELRSLTGSRGLNLFEHDSESVRFLGRDDIRLAAEELSKLDGSIDIVNHGALPWEYPLTRLLKKAHNRRVGYFYPVKGSPASPAPDRVIDIGDHPGPEYIRHGTGAVYRRGAVRGPFTVYDRVGTVPAGAVVHHAIGRFGIGAEVP